MRTTFLLLFRGVGGPVQLPVAALRAALTKAGFKQATTYINSGNALVRSALTREETLAKVVELCRKKFNYERPIFIPTAAEWAEVVKLDPFPQKVEGKHVHAVLLAEKPKPEAVKALQALAVDGEALSVCKKPIGAIPPLLPAHAARLRHQQAGREVRQGHRRDQHRAQLEHGAEDARAGAGTGSGGWRRPGSIANAVIVQPATLPVQQAMK
jgi:uncharacterized protein (DUF1697 family)